MLLVVAEIDSRGDVGGVAQNPYTDNDLPCAEYPNTGMPAWVRDLLVTVVPTGVGTDRPAAELAAMACDRPDDEVGVLEVVGPPR